ncbi:MAG TPA: hypothetical protein DDW50_19055, partial [Firmicutes bacterium]|nr:hypothetical protein [Bacillota bacterium]
MLIKFVLPFFLLVCTITVLLTIILYSWLNRRANSTLKSYLCSLTILIVWLISEILAIFATHSLFEKWILAIHFLTICYMGIVWLIFCLWYSESKIIKDPKNILLMGIIPTICFIGITINSFYGSFLRFNHGFVQILFWLYIIETYLYYGLGMIFFIRYSWKQIYEKKKQIIFMALVGFILFIANAFQMVGNIRLGIECTPLIFAFMLILFAFIIFKQKLLNTESLAMEKMMENMKEAILVTDCFNHIIDFNPALRKAFTDYEKIKIGSPINAFVDQLQGSIENNSESIRMLQAIATQKPIQTCGPIDLIKPKKRCFIVNIWPVFSGKDLMGRVLSFNDITLAKNLWDELYTTNNQLSVKNQQLNHNEETVAELAVARERNRFARDVHDTLGQTMTLLITLLQIAKMSYRINPEKSETHLDKALKIAGEGLAEV